jgi:hypothetical protein
MVNKKILLLSLFIIIINIVYADDNLSVQLVPSRLLSKYEVDMINYAIEDINNKGYTLSDNFRIALHDGSKIIDGVRIFPKEHVLIINFINMNVPRGFRGVSKEYPGFEYIFNIDSKELISSKVDE